MKTIFIILALGIPGLAFLSAIMLILIRAFSQRKGEIKGLTNRRGELINSHVYLFLSLLLIPSGIALSVYAFLNSMHHLHYPAGGLLGFGITFFATSKQLSKAKPSRRA